MDTTLVCLLGGWIRNGTLYDDGKRRRRRKEKMEESSKVLLNPSAPEATFRYKAGEKTWYVGNVVEGVGENGSFVLDYAYEQNVYT